MKGVLPNRLRSPWFILVACLFVSGFALFLPQVQALIGRQEGGASSHSGHLIRQPAAVTSNLSAWWKLDSDGNDASNNGNTCTFQGTTVAAAVTAGRFGKAMSFSQGSSQYATCGTATAFSGAFSVSVWVKTSTLNSTGYTTFLDNTHGSSAHGWFLGDNGPTSTNIVFRVADGSAHDATFARSLMNDGNWHMVTGVYDGASTTTLYLDGTLKNTNSSAGYTANTGAVTQIADNNSSGGTTVIDDARIYGRAITAAEITKLYQGSSPVPCDQTCVGYWKLDSAGTVATHPGVIAGSPAVVNGKFGKARSYSSTSDTISASAITGYDATSAGQNTLSFWMYWDGTHTGIPICYGSNYCLWITSSYFGYTTFNSDVYGVARAALPANSWVHIVAVFTNNFSTNFASNQLYINGSAQTLSQQQGTPVNRSAGSIVTIGTAGSNHYTGYLDDVRDYNYALSSGDVTSIYTAGSTNVLLNSSLIGYWPLDETTGTIAYDAIPNGYTATDTTTNDHFGTLSGFTFDGTTNGANAGVFGNGLQFAGSQGVILSGITETTLRTGTGITYALWMYPTANAGDPIGALSQPRLNYGGGVFRWWPGSTQAGPQIAYPSLNTWHFVVGTYDLTTANLYVDGKLAASLTGLSGTIGGGGTQVYGLGGQASSTTAITGTYTGSLDDVRIYTRALTAEEVAEMYSAGH